MAMAKYLHITAAPGGTILGPCGKKFVWHKEGCRRVGQQKKEDHRVKDGWA
jgi:hypothetical protein